MYVPQSGTNIGMLSNAQVRAQNASHVSEQHDISRLGCWRQNIKEGVVVKARYDQTNETPFALEDTDHHSLVLAAGITLVSLQISDTTNAPNVSRQGASIILVAESGFCFFWHLHTNYSQISNGECSHERVKIFSDRRKGTHAWSLCVLADKTIAGYFLRRIPCLKQFFYKREAVTYTLASFQANRQL